MDLLYGEEVDMAVKPHPLSFIGYHVFFIYLIFVDFFLWRFHLLLEENASVLSILSLLDAVLSILGMNIVDAVFIVSFWIALTISSLIGSRLLHNRMLMLYAVLVAASGTMLEVYWSMTHYEIAFIQRSSFKLILLAGTAAACMILVEIYRRRHLYIVTNHRVIIRGGLIPKEEEIAYRDIARIYVKQGILGRIFNFGTIIIHSTFGFDLNVSQYREFSEALETTSEKAANRTLEENFKSRRKERPLLLLGVPDPRRVRIIMGNRALEAKESSL